MRRSLLALLVLSCVVPASASAARVITAPDGTRLSVEKRAKELCLRIDQARGESSEQCNRLPSSVLRSFTEYGYSDDDTAWHAGVTTAEIMRVQLSFDGGAD